MIVLRDESRVSSTSVDRHLRVGVRKRLTGLSFQSNRRLFWCLLSLGLNFNLAWQPLFERCCHHHFCHLEQVDACVNQARMNEKKRFSWTQERGSSDRYSSSSEICKEPSKFVDEEAERAKTQKSRAAARCTRREVQEPKRGSLYQ